MPRNRVPHAMGGKKRERREAERAHALASKHANLDPADYPADEQDGSAKRDDEARKIAKAIRKVSPHPARAAMRTFHLPFLPWRSSLKLTHMLSYLCGLLVSPRLHRPPPIINLQSINNRCLVDRSINQGCQEGQEASCQR